MASPSDPLSTLVIIAGFFPLKNSTVGNSSMLIALISPSFMLSPFKEVLAVISARSICCVLSEPAFNLANPSFVSPAGLLEAPELTAFDNSRRVKLFLRRLISGTTTRTIGSIPPRVEVLAIPSLYKSCRNSSEYFSNCSIVKGPEKTTFVTRSLHTRLLTSISSNSSGKFWASSIAILTSSNAFSISQLETKSIVILETPS